MAKKQSPKKEYAQSIYIDQPITQTLEQNYMPYACLLYTSRCV